MFTMSLTSNNGSVKRANERDREIDCENEVLGRERLREK